MSFSQANFAHKKYEFGLTAVSLVFFKRTSSYRHGLSKLLPNRFTASLLAASLWVLACADGAWANGVSEVHVDASNQIGAITPLWNDYWELNVQHGYGPNPLIYRITHTPLMEDPGFLSTMALLRPRSVRISVGAFVTLPHTDYKATDPGVLRGLPTEFYRGENTLAAADDPANYNFDYLDAQLDAVTASGAEVFLNFDYMPFTLAANQTPHYHENDLTDLTTIGLFDNEVRTALPADNAVYARVIKNVILHTKGLFKGTKHYPITYYEIANEPDRQTWTDAIPNFWGGDEEDLFAMYAAIAVEINSDARIKNDVKLGCCSFAVMDPPQIEFTEEFLDRIAQNRTRLDFLSIHPYSSNGNGSLDAKKIELAMAHIERYAPGAELVNSEWGILDARETTFTETLEHELRNFRDVVFMLDRAVKFAHYVRLVESHDSGNKPALGVCTVNPVAPKIAAAARANMNKLRDTPVRLAAESSGDAYVLAGVDEGKDKIVVVVAALRNHGPAPSEVTINVSSLPWADTPYSAILFELSASDFDAGNFFKAVKSASGLQGDFHYQVQYNADQNSGRLYTLVLEKTNGGGRVPPPQSGPRASVGSEDGFAGSAQSPELFFEPVDAGSGSMP